MIIDNAGTYTLRYTATDDCGKTTTVDRELVVEELIYRTVLYTDGTLIINESPRDIARNVQLHGEPTNIYDPLDSEHDYVFSSDSDRPWNSKRNYVTSVEIGSSISPQSISHWFSSLEVCVSMSLDELDTSNVTDFTHTFQDCRALTSLDLSGFNTSNATTMEEMFISCTHLASLNVSNFDTTNVTTMYGMFNGCNALTSLDLSSFDTSNVTDMLYMFTSCRALTSLDLSGFNTSKVDNFYGMFDGCSSLTSLNISNFNTSRVTNMSYMFRQCRSLQTLDLSSFTVNNLTRFGEMFYGCQALETIYASVSFYKPTTGSDVFYGTSNLVGGSGTSWSASNPTNGTYARIDNPPDAPGYFTLKSA